MPTNRMNLCLTKLLILISHCSCDCPPSLSEIAPGLCISVVPSTDDFCHANQLCIMHGKETGQHLVLIGRKVGRLAHNFTHEFINLWTTINDAFSIAVGENKWRDGDPRDPLFLSTPGTLLWHIGEPKYGYQLAIWSAWPFGHLQASSGYETRSMFTVCELIGPMLSGRRLMQFKTNYPPPTVARVFSISRRDPCHESVIATSLISCAFKCAQKLECRASHYNEQLSTCILSLHIDSPVTGTYRNRGGHWQRFAKTGLDTVLTD